MVFIYFLSQAMHPSYQPRNKEPCQPGIQSRQRTGQGWDKKNQQRNNLATVCEGGPNHLIDLLFRRLDNSTTPQRNHVDQKAVSSRRQRRSSSSSSTITFCHFQKSSLPRSKFFNYATLSLLSGGFESQQISCLVTSAGA